MAVCHLCKALYIEHAAARIGYGLTKQRLGVWAKSLLYFLVVGCWVYVCAVYAELFQRHTEEIVCSSVYVVAHHDMSACLADVEDGIEVGGLTA